MGALDIGFLCVGVGALSFSSFTPSATSAASSAFVTPFSSEYESDICCSDLLVCLLVSCLHANWHCAEGAIRNACR